MTAAEDRFLLLLGSPYNVEPKVGTHLKGKVYVIDAVRPLNSTLPFQKHGHRRATMY